jgi:hypothetical protein
VKEEEQSGGLFSQARKDHIDFEGLARKMKARKGSAPRANETRRNSIACYPFNERRRTGAFETLNPDHIGIEPLLAAQSRWIVRRPPAPRFSRRKLIR